MISAVADTKTRILEAAEKLFGSKGFESTSLRDITTQAHVNLAAVNYHFQSKESLIDAVIERRMAPVNKRRIEMLEAAGAAPTLEQILEAFVSPLLNQPTLPSLLAGQVLVDPKQFAERFFKHLADAAQRFANAIQLAVPGLSNSECFWRLHFAGGAMAHLLRSADFLPAMSNGLCDPTDRKAMVARLVGFLAAGFRAPEIQFPRENGSVLPSSAVKPSTAPGSAITDFSETN